jgi:hypothetical protein
MWPGGPSALASFRTDRPAIPLYYNLGVDYEWVSLLLAMLRGIEPYEVRQVLEDKRPRWLRRAVGAGGIPVLAIWGRTRGGR